MNPTSLPLLPEARVDVWLTDAATEVSLRKLSGDWRFARVGIQLQQGGIEQAVARYKSERSPDVLLIEIDKIDTGFTQQLEVLANSCATGTAAIFIGPQNDIALYRHLLEMGATDYLVRPLQSEELAQVIGKALLEKFGTRDSRLITVIGSKGGVGTSRMAQLLATALGTRGLATTLFDCSGSWGLAGATFGQDTLVSLRDLPTQARTQPNSLDELRVSVGPHLHWLAAGGDPLLGNPMTADGFESVLDALMRRYPNIVVDLSQAPTALRQVASARAHNLVLVTSATPLALRNTHNLLKELRQLRGPDSPIHLLVNEAGMLPKEELREKEIAQALDLAPTLFLPFQPDLFARLDMADAENAQKLLLELCAQLQPLAATITGDKDAIDVKPEKSNLLKFFARKG